MIRALQAAHSWINDVCYEALQEWRAADRESEAFYHNHFALHNPDYARDIFKRQMIAVAWEVSAVIALLLGFAGLAFLRG